MYICVARSPPLHITLVTNVYTMPIVVTADTRPIELNEHSSGSCKLKK